jgi:outer membrane protein
MRRLIVLSLLVLVPGSAVAAPLTADEAVKIALQHNSQIVQSDASLLTAKSGMWSAYAGVLPQVSAGLTRSTAYTGVTTGSTVFGNTITPSVSTYDTRSYGTTESVNGSWGLVNLSSWSYWSAARQGMRSAQYGAAATRSAVVFATKQQFYLVVQAMHQAVVNGQALQLARDSERRVRALYEVGSVSKSDLLQAQVNTSQAELNSLTAVDNVTTQRILLAQQLGLAEAGLAEVDSTLTATADSVDDSQILAEARAARPDLRAAEADTRAAELSLRAARWARLPYLGLSGAWTPDSKRTSSFSDHSDGSDPLGSNSESKRSLSGAVSVNLPLFDGLSTDARVASARARVATSRETRDALVRNLDGQVHQAVLAYREATQRVALAQRGVESATENQNLVQQKYNVGSATILDLVTSQVQLQTAQSALVSAMAAIQVSRAQLDQVRGRPQ